VYRPNKKHKNEQYGYDYFVYYSVGNWSQKTSNTVRFSSIVHLKKYAAISNGSTAESNGKL